MQRQFVIFTIRWLLNSFGLWVAVRLLGTGYSDAQIDSGFAVFLLAGLIFSIINSIVRPALVILSLPFIVVTLGLFMLVVNGAMVWLALWLTPGIHMKFWQAILTGIILSLINYIVSSLAEMMITRKKRRNI